ncbi:MAG TPA: ABC transporter ATP-binding protein [Thermoanaerobaculia bacterium]|nr:ABC transporter ATP-binding protein [Thermoanaerobaculia bacterium]
MSAPAVAVAGLTKRFGAFTAVDDVSFTVAPGEIFGFLGPNGAGKTTTIRMLTGLLAPSAGRGQVAGCDLATGRRALRRSIGYMSQLFSLYADLTVAENIAFFAGLYGVTGARFAARRDWVLAMAGLTDATEQPTGALSLGWKQRLALGCAVLHEPPILFLDEPTSGVDPISRRRFWELIRELAGGGTTVFVTTHYMDEAEACDRLALMNRGRLVALDTPSALRAASREPLFAVAVDDPLAALAALDGAPGIVRAGLFGRELHVTTAEAASGEAVIAGHLAGAGVALRALAPVAPSLEDTFIARVEATGGAVAG